MKESAAKTAEAMAIEKETCWREKLRSVSSSPSLGISHSHHCSAADLVRLGGGGVIDGGEGDGSDVGCERAVVVETVVMLAVAMR